jgi:hypothetical protein
MGMHLVTIVLVVICFFRELLGLCFERFYETCPSSFLSINFFSTDPGKEGFQKIAKNNFTHVSKCWFLNSSYQLVFKGSSHTSIIKHSIISNTEFYI